MDLGSFKALLHYIPGKSLKTHLKARLSQNSNLLLEAIQKNQVTDDEGGYHLLKQKANIRRKSYIRLRERLEEKTLSIFLARDFSRLNRSPYFKKILEGYKKMLISRLLAFFGSTQVACYIGQKSLKIGQKYHIYDMVYFNASTLCQRYSFLGNLKLFQYYAQLNRESRAILEKENEAFLYLSEFNTLFCKKTSLTAQEYDTLQQYVSQCRSLLKQCFTPNLYLYYLRLGYFLDVINLNYKKVISEWEAFETYINREPHLYVEGQYAESNLKKLEAALNLDWLDKGEEFWQNCQNVLKTGKNNWFIAHEYYIFIDKEGLLYNGYEPLKWRQKPSKFQSITGLLTRDLAYYTRLFTICIRGQMG